MTTARGSAPRTTARPGSSARALVPALVLLVALAALCAKALAVAGPAGPPPAVAAAGPAPSTVLPDIASPDTTSPDTVAPGDVTGCKDKPPATGTHSVPQPADAVPSQQAVTPAAPRPMRAAEAAGHRPGPAPPAPKHILLSVLRI